MPKKLKLTYQVDYCDDETRVLLIWALGARSTIQGAMAMSDAKGKAAGRGRSLLVATKHTDGALIRLIILVKPIQHII
jgi:hypothetical protein